jgi:hypothetical protein
MASAARHVHHWLSQIELRQCLTRATARSGELAASLLDGPLDNSLLCREQHNVSWIIASLDRNYCVG